MKKRESKAILINPTITIVFLLIICMTSNGEIDNLFGYDHTVTGLRSNNQKKPFNINKRDIPSWSVLSQTILKDTLTSSTLYSTHTPITIEGNDDFQSWPGNGTESDPYVIEGYHITSSEMNLIEISNTNVSFLIKNCLLDGLNGIFDGVNLTNVENGQIDNNTIQNNQNGIAMFHSSNNNFILNNTCVNNNNGIKLVSADFNLISNNTCSDNQEKGITLESADNNTLETNTLIANSLRGIHLYSSKDNILVRNNFFQSNCAILLEEGSSKNNITQNTGETGNCGIAIIVYGCNENAITKNSLTNYQTGISVEMCSLNNISHNIIQGKSTGNAISLTLCSNNFVTNNTCSNHTYGIFLDWTSEGHQITHNLFKDNANYGIILGSSDETGNEIRWNVFVNNNNGFPQASDSGSGNIFKYNHWDDWISPDDDDDGIVDIQYSIDGSANNYDYYPLTTPTPKYKEHAPISINGNNDFHNQAAAEEWLGDGTQTNPYIISGNNITSSSDYLIESAEKLIPRFL